MTTNKPLSAEELLPCPFCGSDNIKQIDDKPQYTCRGCWIDGPTERDGDAFGKVWNTRAQVQQAAPVGDAGLKAIIQHLTNRAEYFDRTNGHFDRKDAAMSYRQTAKEIERAHGSGNLVPADQPQTREGDLQGLLSALRGARSQMDVRAALDDYYDSQKPVSTAPADAEKTTNNK